MTIENNQFTIGDEPVEIKAIFEADPVVIWTVTYHANGGIGTMTPQAFEDGVAQALSTNAFQREGYSFVGWNTKADGSGTSLKDGELCTVASDVILYAQWKKNAVTPSLLIVRQPENCHVTEGERGRFFVEAKGDGLTYQWYINRNDGNGWRKLEGATSSVYITSPADLDCSGFRYICVVSDRRGNVVNSAEAVLYVTRAPNIPLTGDSSSPILWLVIGMLSLLGMLALCRKSRAY